MHGFPAAVPPPSYTAGGVERRVELIMVRVAVVVVLLRWVKHLPHLLHANDLSFDGRILSGRPRATDRVPRCDGSYIVGADTAMM